MSIENTEIPKTQTTIPCVIEMVGGECFVCLLLIFLQR